MDDLSRYLSSCQLGITLTSLGIGFLGEPAVANLVEPLFGDLPHGVTLGALARRSPTSLTTALHITIGEQVPKIYAIQRSEPISRLVARPLYLFTQGLPPVHRAAQRDLERDPAASLGIRTDNFDEGETPEEIRMLIHQSMTGGKLDPGEAGMLTGVFHLHEQQARQVMTPAPAVVDRRHLRERRDRAAPLHRLGPHARGRHRGRQPGPREGHRARQRARRRSCSREGSDASIEDLVREAPIVPETKPLDDLLADLQRQRSSLAVVVDEYGRTAGIVTVEDIIEEVVGEIDDETDPLGGAVRKLANGDWFVRGHVAITDLQDYGLDLPIDTDAYNSVGGYVFGELGRLPKRGDTVSSNGYSIRVESVRENRIEAVRIRDRRVNQ